MFFACCLERSHHHLPELHKSSAIPRLSLWHSRTTPDPRPDPSSPYTRINGVSPSSFPTQCARTYSQPPSPNGLANNPLPTPESSWPTSPRTSDVKPTHIPIAARTRTTSTSSHGHSITQRADSRNRSNHPPCQPPTPDTSQDHWVVRPSNPPQPSTPLMASIRHKASSFMNEPAPFATSSITSSTCSRIQEPIHLDPRPSNDSEGRPFEHWYRAGVHKNGGVSELRGGEACRDDADCQLQTHPSKRCPWATARLVWPVGFYLWVEESRQCRCWYARKSLPQR